MWIRRLGINFANDPHVPRPYGHALTAHRAAGAPHPVPKGRWRPCSVDIDKRLVAFRWPVEVRVILGCSLIEDDQEFLPTATHRVKRDGTQEITNLEIVSH